MDRIDGIVVEKISGLSVFYRVDLLPQCKLKPGVFSDK